MPSNITFPPFRPGDQFNRRLNQQKTDALNTLANVTAVGRKNTHVSPSGTAHEDREPRIGQYVTVIVTDNKRDGSGNAIVGKYIGQRFYGPIFPSVTPTSQLNEKNLGPLGIVLANGASGGAETYQTNCEIWNLGEMVNNGTPAITDSGSPLIINNHYQGVYEGLAPVVPNAYTSTNTQTWAIVTVRSNSSPVSPVQFGTAFSVQGWYNGLIVLGSATTIANGTIPAGALPTSPPSGGGFYAGGACLIINQPDVFLSGVWPIQPNQLYGQAIRIGTTGPSDTPPNTPIYAAYALKDKNCGGSSSSSSGG